jgi:hypothetical protein
MAGSKAVMALATARLGPSCRCLTRAAMPEYWLGGGDMANAAAAPTLLT